MSQIKTYPEMDIKPGDWLVHHLQWLLSADKSGVNSHASKTIIAWKVSISNLWKQHKESQ